MGLYDQNGIREVLATRWAGKELVFFDVTDSTNVQAGIKAIEGAAHGTLLVADRQTAGKGRRGRCWESPAGANIYFSLILRPNLPIDSASMLTLVMAHSVCRALSEYTGLECRIKWPNDVVVNGKKVCGILTELGFEINGSYYLIVGVGINVKQQVFAQELDHAACLEKELYTAGALNDRPVNETLCRSELLAKILKQFEEDYDLFISDHNMKSLLDGYHHMLANRNAEVRVLDPAGEYNGVALGITEQGELMVKRENGVIETVYAGEVSVRGIYDYV